MLPSLHPTGEARVTTMLYRRYYPLLLSLLATNLVKPCVAYFQSPFSASDPSFDESYTFKWPIRKVAIIGAGPGFVSSKYDPFTN